MDKIDEVLTRGVTNIIPNKQKLSELLKSGKKLNVYLGVDPTATHIHIGNAVPLRKLQQFVELGHNVIFLIGDFTALIGDTADKESERPILTYEQIKENFKTYKEQASKILDFSKVKVKFNSEWLDKLSFRDIVKLCQHFSVGDFVGRELIRKRLNENKRVALHEVLYPVMQGYDSYFFDTDVQIGGADQTFNMQAGRVLQKDFRDKESFVVVTGYLEGTDGRKMSKSWGNAIWVDENPNEMFGKVMSVRDDLMITYFTLATNLSEREIAEKEKRLKDGENPITIKRELAFEIVAELHSKKDAEKAQENFEKTFQEKAPEYEDEIKNKGSLVDTLEQVVGSKSEAKRFIKQGGVDVNGVKIVDLEHELTVGDKINLGKRRFLKVT